MSRLFKRETGNFRTGTKRYEKKTLCQKVILEELNYASCSAAASIERAIGEERGGPNPRFLSPAAGGKVVGGLGGGIGREEKSCHISRYRKDRRSVGRFGRGREAPQRRQKVEKLLSLTLSISL